MKRSWKTTTAGILTVLGSLFLLIAPVLDGDPKTQPDFQTHGTVILTALAGLGLLAAKDSNKS